MKHFFFWPNEMFSLTPNWNFFGFHFGRKTKQSKTKNISNKPEMTLFFQLFSSVSELKNQLLTGL